MAREENERVLAAQAPALAARVAAVAVPRTHEVTYTAAAEPLLSVAGVPLHHPTAPVEQAARWARETVGRLERVGAAGVVVVGLGLGYHLEALAARFTGTIVVVEPDDAIWRLAITSRDLTALLGRVRVVDEDDVASLADRTLVVAYAPALMIPGGAHRRALERWQASALRGGHRLTVLVVSPMTGGSWPLAGYCARALTALGHDAHLLDLSVFQEAFARLQIFGARQAQRAVVENQFCETLSAGVYATVDALEPDVVLALAQAPLAVPVLRAIGDRGVVRVLWFVEDYRLFQYWREFAAYYDYVFTIQDGPCLEAVSAVTDAHVAYLPTGFDPAVHRPLDLDPDERARFGSDVAFVGAGYRNRRIGLRRFLDADCKIWGSEWAGAGELGRLVQRDGARVSTDEAVRVFNAARINLNLHSSTYHDDVDPRGDFVNPRTFELAGCGAFQVVDYRRLLPPLFTPGSEVAVAESVAEMRALAGHFLAHEDARREIAARARARALAEHTYTHRMTALLGAVLAPRQEQLLARRRAVTVGDVAAGGTGTLERFLGTMDPSTPFTLPRLAASLAERDGALAEPEAIFLFLHQFDELYLRGHRV